jgi:hypothetical protein
MERKFYTDDFEQLLKDQTDGFRMYPSKRVWHSIYNEMHPGRRWPSIAVSMVLILTLLVVGYWNSGTTAKKTITAFATPSSGNLNTAITTGNIGYNKHTSPVTGNANNVQAFITNTTGTAVQNNSFAYNQPKAKKPAAPLSSGINVFVNNNEASANDKNMLQSSNSISGTTLTDFNVSQSANTVIPLSAVNNTNGDEPVNETVNPIQLNTPELNRVIITAPVADNEITGIINIKENKAVKVNVVADKKIITTEDKVWMEDYAFHNKSKRKQWQDRTASEIYFTPSVGFRHFSNNSSIDIVTANSFISAPVNVSNGSINDAVNQKPGLGLEIGAGLVYSAAKNIRLKIGVQANYTSYVINANETNHPTLTNIMLNDANTGYPYMESRASTLSNVSGYKGSRIPNTTYQLSLPIGVALKLAGNGNLEWYAGATIQPTFVFGGKANLISFDRKNYVKDASLIRQWNLNSGIETYIHYKFAGSTLQIGPQFRYQLGSTYSKKYSLNENLYNVGIKVGLLKNF